MTDQDKRLRELAAAAELEMRLPRNTRPLNARVALGSAWELVNDTLNRLDAAERRVKELTGEVERLRTKLTDLDREEVFNDD